MLQSWGEARSNFWCMVSTFHNEPQKLTNSKHRKKTNKESAFVVPPVQFPYTGDDDVDSHPEKSAPKRTLLSDVIKNTPFLESPEMIKTFCPKEDETVEECLHKRMKT